MINPQLTSFKQEHYTPPAVLCKVRALLGGQIDLDPATDMIANTIVKANKIFTKENDPLSREWVAHSVFLNPPGGRYGRGSLSAAFWDKFINEFKLGHFKIGVFLGFSLELIPKRPEILGNHTLFFGVHKQWHKPNYLTTGGRVKFLNQDLIPQEKPTHGSFLTMVSTRDKDSAVFVHLFSSEGVITKPASIKTNNAWRW